MGRHNAPRKPVIPVFVKASGITLAATGLSVLLAPTASAAPVSSSVLEIIAKCESGNKNVNHNTALSGIKSTASGYLQILDSTWRAFGGTEFASRAINASRAEQFVVGARILNGQGISAWNPSRSCWGSKVGSVKKVEVPVLPKKVAPKVVTFANCDAVRAAGKAPIKPGDPGWNKKFDRDGDGVGCDVTPKPKPVVKATPKAEVKKAVTSAPKVVKKQVAPPVKTVAKKVAKTYLIKKGDTLSGIAKTQGSTVRRLAALNSDTVKNVDLIYAGKKLRLG